MKHLKTIIALTILALFGFTASAQSTKYKCMIQMNSYIGEEAYVVASVVDKNGKYVKTLYLLGKDQKWYPDWKTWHAAHKTKLNAFSAVTGASVAGGDRSVITVEIDNNLINKDYKLRFESAVEDKGYHVNDLEFALTSEKLLEKNTGKGFINFVRFSPAK